MLIEPKYHSYITDGLSKKHPLAFKSVLCSECQKMVHAFNNECMCPWFEFIDGKIICIDCFTNPKIYRKFDLIYHSEKKKRNILKHLKKLILGGTKND